MNPSTLVERLQRDIAEARDDCDPDDWMKGLWLEVSAEELEQLCTSILAADERIRVLTEYAQHKHTCPKWKYIYGVSWPAGKPEPNCTCGLAALGIARGEK